MPDFKRERELKVLRTKTLSKHVKRITFFSEDFLDFSNNEKGGYVKLLFSDKNPQKKNKLVRPYTIREFREKNLEIDIDFIIHNSNEGIASLWASKANIGDTITVSGPGARPNLRENSDWFFFIGDMSSLPAISANLEIIDKKTKGIIVIEVNSKEDQIKINKPDNYLLYWVINNEEKRESLKLYNKVLSLKWLKGNPFIWVACEFSNMQKLRIFFHKEKKIEKEFIYISSYWKKGKDQEEHKIIKKSDSKSWNS